MFSGLLPEQWFPVPRINVHKCVILVIFPAFFTQFPAQKQQIDTEEKTGIKMGTTNIILGIKMILFRENRIFD